MEKQFTVNDEPRKNIEIHLTDGRVVSGPRGERLDKFLKELPEWKNSLIMGAVVNGELRELTFQMGMDAKVKPLKMSDADGARIYRRSIVFLLESAFETLYPQGCKLTIDHSVSSGGYYCEAVGRETLNDEELEMLEDKMKEFVASDLEFKRNIVPIEEAVEFFKNKGYDDKVALLKFRRKKHLVLYELKGHYDYHHGYMVPSTGYLRWFKLTKMGDGFILRFPRRHNPEEILPIPENENLLNIFKLYGGWLSRLGIQNVSSLNEAILQKRIREVVLISEALHEQKISEIATKIIDQIHEKRIVLIAGPSSSGKTTFSKRLAVQLLSQGGEPFALEMDNYFVNRADTPLDENGEYDFESIGAVNKERLSRDLKKLISGEEVQLPHYNFRAGMSEEGETVRLGKNQIIILEGIHGLNPGLLEDISNEATFKIYASCLTQLNLDSHNRISTTDTRLIRRIVRDAKERGYTAIDTIQRWDSVRRGEKRHIFPFQDNADEMFNSALAYELAALKPLAVPLIRQVPYGTDEYIEAKRLLAFLEWFLPLDVNIIPDNSILREFIGGSILKGFKLWKSY